MKRPRAPTLLKLAAASALRSLRHLPAAEHPKRPQMRYYLNNCQNLDHAKIYGGKAMFDLWAEGFEDKVAQELSPGDACLVVSRDGKDKVAFSHYRFTTARLVPDPSDKKRRIWVLEGELDRHEVLPRTEATSRAPYSRFFNKRGHFNQWSVVRGA